MKNFIRIAAILLIAILISAPGPQVGGFGLGGNPRGTSNSQAAFEFANQSGSGMGTVCSGGTITGTRGQAITFTRGSSGVCTRGGNGMRTTGIANGDLVALSTNQPRVEADADGVLGLLIEFTKTNILLRSQQLENAAWADVGTPIVSANATTSPDGTSTADQIADDAAGAFQGRSQSVTVTATNPSVLSCYAKGNTASDIRLSLDGTTADFAGISTATWTRISVLDASASGASISAQVLVGDAVGDTGNAFFWGCQVESGIGISYMTSYISTTSATVTRSTDNASFTSPQASGTTISLAGNFTGPIPASGSARAFGQFTAIGSLYNEAAGSMRWYSGGVAQTVAFASSVNGIRYYGYHDGSVRGMAWGANAAGPTADVNATNKWGASFFPGGNVPGGGGTPADGIISRQCIDPSPTRCR